MPDSVRAENAVLLSKVVKKTYRYYRAIVNDLRTLYIFLFKQSCLLSVTHWAFRFHLADLAGFGCRCFLGVRGCSSLSPLECQDENPEEKMEENVRKKTGRRRDQDQM